ncbi:MAG: B12-binding domain-containing radical SAM protein [Planctomycetes bacterium]|nr:B12-binding domain-containing radical SAM protein [Planctomycetota bacterium]
MKIQLIHPPVYLNVHAMTALRPSMPLGLAYIAAIMERAGHQVSVVDAVALAPERVVPDGKVHRLGLDPEDIVKRIDADTDLIGITNMWSFSWPLVRKILHLLKEAHPTKPILAGGEHFTGLPELSFQQSPVDYIVMGEGEETCEEFLEAFEHGQTKDGKSLEEIPGLAFRRGDEIVKNPRRERIKSVDSLPWPAWHLIDIDIYDEKSLVTGLHKGKTLPILATRGCPYQCSYCSSPTMWTTRWYPRNPIDVVDEIAHYKQTYGATNFPFQDLTAIIKKDWIVQFCNEIIDRKLDIVWQFPSGTRCEVIDDEVAELLYRSGGRHLAFAPESGSEVTRELIKKRMKTESLLNAVEASVRHKLNVTAFFVIGFPHDKKEHIRDTVRLARKLAVKGIDDIAIGFYFPIPNTQIWRELVARGDFEVNDDSLMTPIFANDEKLLPDNNYCDHLTHKQLTWLKYKILLNFYPVSFLTHPLRIFKIFFNVVRGKETRKLETFLVELKRKSGIWIRTKLRLGRPAAKPAG